MPEFLAPYDGAILALGLFGILYLGQLIAADVIGILAKHTPGTPVTGGHDDLLFRASRAHANTSESVGALILIAAFAILRGAEPAHVNGAVWFVLACRVGHTAAYYLDLRIVRSIVFALGLVGLVALFLAGLRAG